MDHLVELLETTPAPRVGFAIQTARGAVSRRHLARSAGLRPLVLRQIERGERPVSADELRAIAAALQTDVRALLPPRLLLTIDPIDGGFVAVGDRTKRLPIAANDRDILRAYLHLVRELRNRAPNEPLPLRDDDLEVLAHALGDDAANIETNLVELIDMDAEEASRLRVLLLRRRVLAPVAGVVIGVTGVATAAAATAGDSRVHTTPQPSARETVSTVAASTRPTVPTTAVPAPTAPTGEPSDVHNAPDADAPPITIGDAIRTEDPAPPPAEAPPLVIGDAIRAERPDDDPPPPPAPSPPAPSTTTVPPTTTDPPVPPAPPGVVITPGEEPPFVAPNRPRA